MRFASIVRHRLRSLLNRQAVDRELEEELRYHLERQMTESIAAGISPDKTRRYLAGVTQRKEECRDMRGLNVIDNLVHDSRFALRQLRKNPGFTLTAVVMLALGLSASVALFAFVDAALIRPLPYRDAGRLVGLFESLPLCVRCNLSYLDYLDWKKLNTVFSSVDAWQGTRMMMRTDAGAEQVPSARVTAGFFRTLGVRPALGRDFAEGEDQPSATRTVLLSYSAWQKRYGGRPEIIGQPLTLNNSQVIIAGVLPPDFHFAPVGPAEFWIPLQQSPGCEQNRGCHNMFAIARLKDGVSVPFAASNIASIAGALERQYPDTNRGQGSNIVSLSDVIVGQVRPILLVLLSGAALLLLIAGVNAVNLLLVRSESRRREMAVRCGLGASTSRLITQFVTEAVVLVAVGSGLALVLASWIMQLLTGLLPRDMSARMPYLANLGLNWRVLLFAGLLSVLAAILFAITPAMRLSWTDLRQTLAEGSRGAAGVTWRRLGSKLVILELATAVVLMVGAGLLVRSLHRLLQVNLGMQPERLATMRVALPSFGPARREKSIALARQLIDRVNAMPGVESAALSTMLPLIGGNTMWIRVIGHPYNGEHNEVSYREVSSSYLATLGARLIRGRHFTDADDASKPPVAIIDRALADKYLPGEDPVGKQLAFTPNSTDPPMQIIGVVDTIKEGALDAINWPAMYVPFNQVPNSSFSLVVRTAQSDPAIFRTLVSAIREIDPGITTFDQRSMVDRINNSPAAYLRRSSAWLVGGFAVLALLLGVVGLYGVIVYSVSQRTREIGVRMALGARPSMVYRMVLKEAGYLVGVGIAIGLVLAMAAGSLMSNLLFGVNSRDVPTLVAVVALLGSAALVASFIPARRAASVNPVEALHAE